MGRPVPIVFDHVIYSAYYSHWLLSDLSTLTDEYFNLCYLLFCGNLAQSLEIETASW